MYYGLMDFVRYDVVWENDGDVMMGYWRYDVV